MDNLQIFKNFLASLGLTEEEASLFVLLTQNGPQTVLSLSRLSGINRTRVYRLIDHLETLGLVHKIIEENKTFFKAAGLNKLELTLKEKEEEINRLRHLLPTISSLFPAVSALGQPDTKVIFYRGREGVRQQGWNTLRAKTECLGFTFRVYSEIVGQKFAEDWASEVVRRGIHFREILSDVYYQSIKEKSEYKAVTFGCPNFERKYISSKILVINHQMDIYNNVVSIYNWYEGEVFGVEIYNEKVANFQRQLFELVWKIAKKIPKKLLSS